MREVEVEGVADVYTQQIIDPSDQITTSTFPWQDMHTIGDTKILYKL